MLTYLDLLIFIVFKILSHLLEGNIDICLQFRKIVIFRKDVEPLLSPLNENNFAKLFDITY